MMKLNHKYLFNAVFIVSLGLLIANDNYFKEAYHISFTGKLSDLTGVIVLFLFLNSLQDKRKIINALAGVLLFAYWKSPLSQPFINSFNELGFYKIN